MSSTTQRQGLCRNASARLGARFPPPCQLDAGSGVAAWGGEADPGDDVAGVGWVGAGVVAGVGVSRVGVGVGVALGDGLAWVGVAVWVGLTVRD